MADFCKQCSEEEFGEDFGDMNGITTSEGEAKRFFAVVLCEGCGPCQVDSAGRCVSANCLAKHGREVLADRTSGA